MVPEQFAEQLGAFDVEHLAQPQTPPRPFQLEPVETPAKTAALDESKECSSAKTAAMDETTSSDTMVLLHELLGGIRSSLERRFETLEQRFETHVGHVDARVTVLENELRIMNARMRSHCLERAATDVSPSAAPAVAVGSPVVTSTSMNFPTPLESPSLRQEQNNQSASPCVAYMGTDSTPRFERFDLGRMRELAPQAQLQPQEQALVDKLQEQFRDTQRLLSKAQAQICSTVDGAQRGAESVSLGPEEPLEATSCRIMPMPAGMPESATGAPWDARDAMGDDSATSKTWCRRWQYVNQPCGQPPTPSVVAPDAALWAALHGTTTRD